MYIHSNGNTIVGYFRSSRKCFSFNGSFVLLFVLLVTAANIHKSLARPSHDDDLPHEFNGEEFRDVDNLEIHRVKMVNGVPQEDHPIIIYKEDFVSEDYVPPRNETKTEKHKRRYKDIGHRRRHNKHNITDVMIEEKPEKILFDIIPDKPLIVPEDMHKHRKSHMKLVPLIEGFEVKDTDNEETTSKAELQKRPKKFHRRIRRDASHVLHKRNPYFRHVPKVATGDVQVQGQVQYVYVKHAVPGKKHNGLDLPVPGPKPTSAPARDPNDPISFDNRVAADENDRVIFASGKTTPRTTRRPTESIFRDPRPENFDFSFLNPQRQPTTTTTRTPIFSRRPQTQQQTPQSIFRDPRPENFDFSFMNQGQQTQQQNTISRASTTSRPDPTTQGGISQCVWAIVNCCSSRNSEIRYSCFEQNGCYGAFWGLNPCADNVRDNFINYVADYYN
ncbi:hadley [Cochliomyia hominivorax]